MPIPAVKVSVKLSKVRVFWLVHRETGDFVLSRLVVGNETNNCWCWCRPPADQS